MQINKNTQRAMHLRSQWSTVRVSLGPHSVVFSAPLRVVTARLLSASEHPLTQQICKASDMYPVQDNAVIVNWSSVVMWGTIKDD